MLYTKLLLKIESFVELRTNARQHSIERHMASCICHLNQKEYYVAFSNIFLESVLLKYV